MELIAIPLWLFFCRVFLCSVDSSTWTWHHTDPSAEKQLRDAPTLHTGDSASVFSAQAAASGPDQQLQQPAYWWQSVSGAAASTQHAGETRRGGHVLDDIHCSRQIFNERMFHYDSLWYYKETSWCWAVAGSVEVGTHTHMHTKAQVCKWVGKHDWHNMRS